MTTTARKSRLAELTAGTELHRQELLDSGMTELTADEWNAHLERLGYRIDPDMVHTYVNNLNPGHPTYKARSLNYTDVETGMGAFHYQGRRDSRFAELQKLRFECFVWHRGRIWDL